MQYIQHMSYVLEDKLGANHKNSELLKSIVNPSEARNAIETICHDPEIHKIYFPVHVDTSAQVAWCKNVLCGYPGPPTKYVYNIWCRSNGQDEV